MPTAITSGYKFFGTDQHIYLICDKNKFIGFIKVGFKHLFIYDEIGIPIEINPLCVLDFYTYESCQRKGYGKIMFSEMLSKEKIEPKKMGFDRPSPKFLNFLNKYYGLNDYIPQNNNYVVFKDYFKDEPVKRDRHNIYNNYNSYNGGNNYNNSYNNSNNSYNNSNNYNSNNNISSNYNRNILSQRKLGKLNRGNDNENNHYNNKTNSKNNEMSKKDKEFTSRIYHEYYNSNEKKKEESDEEDNYKYNQKKSFGYNQYQSTSSEYGAFFHLNK